jgi:glycosyltransferase involved in cell wall biosynthesis
VIRLFIAGDGDWMGKLRDYVREHRIGGVEFVGWIEPDRMPEFLAQAHIGLLPLIPDTENADWMRCKSPTKFFEYMAMELPTVASRYGEVESIVTDGRESFLAANRQEFVDKLCVLVENESLRREMGKKARARVEEKYCHKVMGDGLVKVIERVMRRGHHER